jgi:predicted permease
MSVALLIGALVLGFIAARIEAISDHMRRGVPALGSLALFVLLFALGISLGNNQELMSALPTLGWRALVLSSGAVLGSVFLVWLVVERGGRSK